MKLRLFPPQKRWFVRAVPYDYGSKVRIVIFPKRWQRFYQNGVGVVDIALNKADSEQQIEAAKERAHSLAIKLRELERGRP